MHKVNWLPYNQHTRCGPLITALAKTGMLFVASPWSWEALVPKKVFDLIFGVKWFKFKLNFCFCEGNRFSKLNNYRQVVFGEEQLEMRGRTSLTLWRLLYL